jgi:hypothetical protein
VPVFAGSPEREAKGFHAQTKKLDFKLPIGNGPCLSDQLVQSLLCHRADALLVDVKSVRGSRRLSVDQNAKFHRRSRPRRTHDEMNVARVKPVCDTAVWLVQFNGVALYRPIAG